MLHIPTFLGPKERRQLTRLALQHDATLQPSRSPANRQPRSQAPQPALAQPHTFFYHDTIALLMIQILANELPVF